MKKLSFWILSILLNLFVFNSYAQVSELDKLRARPDTNVLKINKTELEPMQIGVAASALDLKVNYWRHWTTFGINANQAAFSDNWNGGGVNSISLETLINHKSDYTKNNTSFVTTLDFKYGKIKNKDQSARKSTDRLFWDNKLSVKVSKSWSIFTSLTFESQIDEGFKYEKKKDGSGGDSLILISNFMSPGSITESFGIEYKKDKTFSLRFGTGTARQTFILDKRLVPPEGGPPKFGVPGGKNFKNDLAFQIVADLDKNVHQNLNIKSRYSLFANYKDVTDPSHRLDLTLTSRVTRLINVTLNGVLIYDSAIDSKVQASQTLAMGLLYKIPK